MTEGPTSSLAAPLGSGVMGAGDPSANTRRARLAAGGARWAGELLTVFVGVCAAFLFNNYQLHRVEHERREQILGWLEDTCAEQLAGAKEGHAAVQKHADEFNRALNAGEMPPLHAFTWISDYDPSDVASMLASGGFDLLEIQTVRQVKDVERTLRQILEIVKHDQQLSDTYILPNLGRDRSVFYDPATQRLRPIYDWYADYFQSAPGDYAVLQSKLEKLLAQVRAERRRNR